MKCPKCQGRTRRYSGRIVVRANPTDGGQIQYRACLNPDCQHRFKAVILWSIAEIEIIQPTSVPT